MRAPDAVYADWSGIYYLAQFEDGAVPTWYRWPAEHDGWRLRKHAAASDADEAEELPADLADLAFRLSGVPIDD